MLMRERVTFVQRPSLWVRLTQSSSRLINGPSRLCARHTHTLILLIINSERVKPSRLLRLIFAAEAPHCLRGSWIKRELLESVERMMTSNSLTLVVFFPLVLIV